MAVNVTAVTDLVQHLLDNFTFLINATSSNDTGLVNKSSPEEDFLKSSLVHVWMREAIIPFLAMLGIVGNTFAIVVWRMKTSFNTTVFLFKFLAVLDAMFLLTDIVYCYIFFLSGLMSVPALVIWHFSNYIQLVAVHITLSIAICRWIAVTFPFRVQRLLTSPRIYLSCVLILVYCGGLEGWQMSDTSLKDTNLTTLIAKQCVGLVLPLLLLMVFNLSLLRTVTQRPKFLSLTDSEKPKPKQLNEKHMGVVDTEEIATETETCGIEESNEDEQNKHHQDEQQQQHHHSHHHSQQVPTHQKHHTKQICTMDVLPHTDVRQLRKRQMVIAVLLVSLCSFISYPIGISLHALVLFHADYSKQETIVMIYIIYICQIMNSSINVLIYWFFVSKFRQLAADLRSRLSNCTGGEEEFSL